MRLVDDAAYTDGLKNMVRQLALAVAQDDSEGSIGPIVNNIPSDIPTAPQGAQPLLVDPGSVIIAASDAITATANVARESGCCRDLKCSYSDVYEYTVLIMTALGGILTILILAWFLGAFRTT